MKSPRFLAALAMAAVLTTGVTTTAHASGGQLPQLSAPGKFTPDSGNNVNGQTPMQKSEVADPNTTGAISQHLNTSGDIEVNGEFKKTINNFPTPDKEGRYLRVTMPIQMNFTYNVDNNDMKSAQGVITNSSVLATKDTSSQTIKTEFQKVTMTIAGFEDSNNGIATMDKAKTEFVDSVNKNDKTKIQLPFALKIDSPNGHVATHSLKRIKEVNGSNNALPTIDIEGNSTLTLEIDKINGQRLGNPELITDHTTLTSHNLKLKFEYTGK